MKREGGKKDKSGKSAAWHVVWDKNAITRKFTYEAVFQADTKPGCEPFFLRVKRDVASKPVDERKLFKDLSPAVKLEVLKSGQDVEVWPVPKFEQFQLRNGLVPRGSASTLASASGDSTTVADTAAGCAASPAAGGAPHFSSSNLPTAPSTTAASQATAAPATLDHQWNSSVTKTPGGFNEEVGTLGLRSPSDSMQEASGENPFCGDELDGHDAPPTQAQLDWLDAWLDGNPSSLPSTALGDGQLDGPEPSFAQAEWEWLGDAVAFDGHDD